MLSAVVRRWRPTRHGVGTRRVLLPLRDQEGHVGAEPSSGVCEHWKKSSASGADGCVEVRRTRSGIQIRDSKDPAGTILHFSDAEWIAFVRGVALGEFGIPAPAVPYAL